MGTLLHNRPCLPQCKPAATHAYVASVPKTAGTPSSKRGSWAAPTGSPDVDGSILAVPRYHAAAGAGGYPAERGVMEGASVPVFSSRSRHCVPAVRHQAAKPPARETGCCISAASHSPQRSGTD